LVRSNFNQIHSTTVRYQRMLIRTNSTMKRSSSGTHQWANIRLETISTFKMGTNSTSAAVIGSSKVRVDCTSNIQTKDKHLRFNIRISNIDLTLQRTQTNGSRLNQTSRVKMNPASCRTTLKMQSHNLRCRLNIKRSSPSTERRLRINI
jgi:hypothetical protein